LGVTPEFRSRLIYKYLSTRFRALYSRLSSDIRDDYDKMKEAILKDLGLSAKTFLERFNRVKKRPSDTLTLYESRLAALLKQYLSSRQVETFDSLVDLLVSDRMKSDLNEACLRHIVGLESVIGDDGWIEPKRLAGIIDDYVANVGPALHPTATFVGQPKDSRRTNVPAVSVKTDKNCSDPEKPEKTDSGNSKSRFDPGESKTGGGRACYNCGSHFHLVANCNQPKSSKVSKQPKRTVNQISAQPDGADDGGQRSSSRAAADVNNASTPSSAVNRVEVMISQNESFQSILDTFDKHRVIADGEVALHYVNVAVSDAHDNVVAIDALFDSGAENSVIRSDVVKELQYSVLGSVTLKAFDGHCSKGVLTILNVRLSTADDNVSVRFVVSDNVSHPCLLSLSDYRRLLKQGEDAVVRHDDVCVYEHCNMSDENVQNDAKEGVFISNAENDTADDVHDDESVMKSDACDDIDLPVPKTGIQFYPHPIS